jgi:hypothetical protein
MGAVDELAGSDAAKEGWCETHEIQRIDRKK